MPLGYRVEAKKLVVVEADAEQVRLIFRHYLELGSIGKLLVDLRERNLVTKRLVRSGVVVRGGIPFTRGPLAHLLRNRFYVGEIAFRGAVYAAEHPAILDRELFDAVQRRLAEQRTGDPVRGGKSEALLAGRIFDDRGHRMTPSHARKAGMRYAITSAGLSWTAGYRRLDRSPASRPQRSSDSFSARCAPAGRPT